MKKLEELKTFAKEHKKELVIGTGIFIGSALIFAITKKKLKTDVPAVIITKTSMIDKGLKKPEEFIDVVDKFWQDEYGKNAFMSDIDAKDVGAVNQALLKAGSIAEDSRVMVLISYYDK